METNAPPLASSQRSSTPIPADGVYTYQHQQQSSTSAHSADAMTSSYADSDEVGAMTEFVSEWSDDEDLLARETRDNNTWDADAALNRKKDSGRRVSRSSFDGTEPAAEIERVYQEAIALMEGHKAMQKPRIRMPLAGCGVAGTSASKKRWLDEAKQQKRLLLHAKSEGLKLRTEIRIEKERARSLYRILMKRLDKIALLRKELYYAIPRSVQFADTGSLYARLLDETNAMVEHADAMKRLLRTRVPLPTKNGSFRGWRVNYDATSGVQLEFVDSEELPFPQYYVNNAMQEMYRSYELDKIIRQSFNTSDDTIMTMTLSTYADGSAIEYLRHRQVVRSFTTDNVSVFISTLIAEPMTDSWEPISGTTAKMQEWRFISACDNGTTVQETIAISSFEVSSPDALNSTAKSMHRGFPYSVESLDASFSMTNRLLESLLIKKQATTPVAMRCLC